MIAFFFTLLHEQFLAFKIMSLFNCFYMMHITVTFQQLGEGDQDMRVHKICRATSDGHIYVTILKDRISIAFVNLLPFNGSKVPATLSS